MVTIPLEKFIEGCRFLGVTSCGILFSFQLRASAVASPRCVNEQMNKPQMCIAHLLCCGTGVEE